MTNVAILAVWVDWLRKTSNWASRSPAFATDFVRCSGVGSAQVPVFMGDRLKRKVHHNAHAQTKSSHLAQTFFVGPWMFRKFDPWLTDRIQALPYYEANNKEPAFFHRSSFYPCCREVGVTVWVGLCPICNRIAIALLNLA